MKIATSGNCIVKDIWQKRHDTFQSFLKGRLVVPVSAAIHLIDLDQILYLSADSNYCRIVMHGGQSILSSKPLKFYELSLINRGFLRVHARYLVNLEKVTNICKENGYSVCLESGDKVPISRAFKSQLFVGSL